jgi:integrase
MGSIVAIKDKWRAQVRRKGHATQTKTFAKKIFAEKWITRIESDIDAGRTGILAPSLETIGSLIDRYTKEISKHKPFGRNKAGTLKLIKDALENVTVAALTPERVVKYITEERQVSGVTAAIDLTYLKGVLKVARAMWKINVQPGLIDDAREILKYMGMAERSNERDRRPTLEEIEGLKKWFGEHSDSLTPERVDFILDSCFRPPSEITRLRWDDLNHEDKTILIRDRKDPRKKIGNNQVVPLLGQCYEIIMRQPKNGEFIFPANIGTWSSIFPRACTDLGIVDLRLYDLRHEAISRMVESSKYSIPEMMLVSGHKDPKQLMRYTQLKAKNLVGR